jgi:DNA-binding response OmpR family regulator
MPVIMMSGHGTIDTAVEATKFGASAFLEKPITLQKLLRAVEVALVKPGQRVAPPPANAGEARRRAARAAAFRARARAVVRSLRHCLWPPCPAARRSEQSFDLDRPLREARDAFEKSYFEFHLAKEAAR